MEVYRDRVGSASGGDPVGGLSEKRVKSLLLLADNIGREMATALTTGGPGLDAVKPVDVERSGHHNSGERKESGERDGETKQHGKVG